MTVFHVKFALQSQLRNVMLNFVSNPIETVIINQPPWQKILKLVRLNFPFFRTKLRQNWHKMIVR